MLYALLVHGPQETQFLGLSQVFQVFFKMRNHCMLLYMPTGTPNIGPALVLPPPHSGHGRREIVG